MSIRLSCTQCGSKLKAPESALGRSLKCPKCAALVLVEKNGDAPLSSMAPAESLAESSPPEIRTRWSEVNAQSSQGPPPLPSADEQWAVRSETIKVPRQLIAPSAYLESTLLPGEEVAALAEIHWSVYIAGFLLIPACGLGFLLLLFAHLIRRTTEFAVTNQRVLIKRGILSRQTWEMNLAKVENIQINQGLLGRYLNYGTVIISGTGGAQGQVSNIARPLEFRRAVQEQWQKKTE